ncbi:metallophosphoesterase [Tautonia marina]|uniref:metallophosphoesterase n=1 Tax=Tautonia marina TaxID=2653855 RepID=UPI001260ED38|nr:metallophosphoesterase [Tautonia marina]
MIDGSILVVVAVGHFCLAVLAVNVFHGIGVPEGTPARVVKGLCLAFLTSISLALMALFLVRPWENWPTIARAYTMLCVLVGLVGLPLVTLARYRRRLPTGVSGHARRVDLTESVSRDDLIGTAWDSFWLRLPGNQAFHLDLTDWQIERTGLPQSLDGLRILHLTDLHLTPAYSDRFFDSMLAQAEAFDADLVVFTGDLIDDSELLDRVEPLLGRFRGRYGQFAILGNHDYRTNASGAFVALRSAGYTVIEGLWRLIETDDGSRVAIGGTSNPWGPLPDPHAMPEADVRILLSHSPDPLAWAARQGIDLMLSGHTHGGQYRLPVIGSILLPSRYSRRYDCGFFQRDATVLFVSRGIAAQHPLRINCPAEISRLTLRSSSRLTTPASLRSSTRVMTLQGPG